MTPNYSELMIYVQQCLKQTHDAMKYGNYELAASIAYEMATASNALAMNLRNINGR